MLHYVIVVVHPLVQHVVVGGQVGVHKHNTRPVHVHADTDGALVAPHAAQSCSRVLCLHLPDVQQVFPAHKHDEQQALHLLRLEHDKVARL